MKNIHSKSHSVEQRRHTTGDCNEHIFFGAVECYIPIIYFAFAEVYSYLVTIYPKILFAFVNPIQFVFNKRAFASLVKTSLVKLEITTYDVRNRF